MNKKDHFVKEERLPWDDFFMEVALSTAKRTACIFHKVASVFVDTNNRIISLGYNGPSKGDFHCNEVGCAKVHGDPVTGECKRCRGAHSEINGIINAGDSKRLRGSTLYITLFPCYDCMKALNNVGIARIVYFAEYERILDGSDGTKKVSEPEAFELAKKRGILLEKFQPSVKSEKSTERLDEPEVQTRW